MMTLIPMADDRVIAVRIDGLIREADMDLMVEDVEDKLTRNDKLRAYVELESLTDIELPALYADLKVGIEHWGRFERKVVVTQMEWVRTAADLLGPLFPWIEVKAFSVEERTQAIAWVTER